MIRIHFTKDAQCNIECKGKRTNILAALPIITGNILKEVLEDCPDDELKELLIKTFFEQTLQQMQE